MQAQKKVWILNVSKTLSTFYVTLLSSDILTPKYVKIGVHSNSVNTSQWRRKMVNKGYVMTVVSSVSLWLTSTLTLSLRDILYSRATRPNKVKEHIKCIVQKSQVRDVLLSASPTGTEEKQTSSKSKVRNRSCRGLSSHQGISGFIIKLWRSSAITHAINLSHYKKVRIGEWFCFWIWQLCFDGCNSTILKCAAVWRVYGWWSPSDFIMARLCVL